MEKSVANDRRKREEEMLCIVGGKGLYKKFTLPFPGGTGGIPAGKSGCHFRHVGRFGFQGSGATFDGERGGRLPSRLDCFAPRDGLVSAGWIAEGPGRSL
jgi:hypothetical protein